MSYIKLYCKMLDDRVIANLSARDFRIYIELYLLSANNDGYFTNLEVVAWRIRKNLNDLVDSIANLEQVGLIKTVGANWKIARFEAEQNPENDWHVFKDQIFERDGHCVYCGGKAEHLDHLYPRSKGGISAPHNLAASCAHCNQSKNHRDLEKWYRRQPFFNQDRWAYILSIIEGKAR